MSLHPTISFVKAKIFLKLSGVVFAAALVPLLAVCGALSRSGQLPPDIALLALGTALLSSSAAGLMLWRGLSSPMVRAAAGIKNFIAGGYKLAEPLPKEGWPESRGLLSSINRVLLELNAYHAFQINQAIEERAKAQALLETITDGVLLVDDRGQLIHSNRRALELLGLHGQGPVQLPDSVTKPEFVQPLRELLASEEKNTRSDLSAAIEADGESVERNFRLISRQFQLATLKRPGRVVIIRDVTIEKEIEGARETFFHMITHDMRAPICSIQGYTELMQKEPVAQPNTGKYLDAIMRSSDRLKGMVEDILNTIKMERGQMALKPVAIDAGELCGRMVELHQPLAARRNIIFSAPPLAARIRFEGDLPLLERIIANLVGNALKFVPAGGAVSLACRTRGKDLLFSVADTGPGIPEGLREDVFRKHYQMDEHKHMGFGLGLAMCKMAVELHGGHIWADARAGGGAVFTFTIPLLEAADV